MAEQRKDKKEERPQQATPGTPTTPTIGQQAEKNVRAGQEGIPSGGQRSGETTGGVGGQEKRTGFQGSQYGGGTNIGESPPATGGTVGGGVGMGQSKMTAVGESEAVEKEELRCDDCGQNFYSLDTYNEHRRSAHEGTGLKGVAGRREGPNR